MIELLMISDVLKAVKSTGTEVVYNHKDCATENAHGWYEFRRNPNIDELVICVDTHTNGSDLLDTVRHEAVHVIQTCKGDTVMPYDVNMQHASAHTLKQLKTYSDDTLTQSLEVEAHNMAEFLSEDDIVGMINKYCF